MEAEKSTEEEAKAGFTAYQKSVVAILAFLQFTLILDFMIISPLGAIVMPALQITPGQFGWIVSSYAFSAAISGLLAAGFADRFDRKRLLLFFYGGFILGTALCAVATSYPMLLMARIVTGLFGGVIGSVVLAIATDLFPLEMRGRVMGLIQTAFAASQVLGQPAGVYFAARWNWHFPFIAIVVLAIPAAIFITLKLRPVDAHLKLRQERSALSHLLHTMFEPKYTIAFLTTALMTTGGYVLMPFGSAFIVHNVGLSLSDLPTIYVVTGLCTVFAGPMIGKASDRFGKFPVFLFGTLLTMIMVWFWTNIGQVGLATVIVINVSVFFGIFARMIPAQALLSAVPEITKRGAFSAISASLQQLSGGIGSFIAGAIIVQIADGPLQHFDWLGYIVIASSAISLVLMRIIQRQVQVKTALPA